MLKKIKLKFFLSFIKVLLLKAKYGNKIKLNPFKIYISLFSKVQISGDGTIEFKSDYNRVYISRNCSIHCSSGCLIIGNGVFFNENNHLVCHEKITIGDNCLFGQNVCFYDSNHEYSNKSILIREQGYSTKAVIISDDVWIGAGSVITKGTCIGHHVVVGANSVVRGNLIANAIYAGNPVDFKRRIN